MNSIGLDVGGTFTKGGIVDENGKILYETKVPTYANKTKEIIINNIYETIELLIEENKKISDKQIDFIGMGIPGMVSRKKGIAEFSGNLNWENVPIVSELKKRGLNIPISICNDSRAASIGETLFGAGQDFNNLIVITIGTGIGAGVILNKKLYEGNGDKGGEVGHEVIVVDGEQCTCSRKGCLEAYASARALIRDTKSQMEIDKNSAMWQMVKNDINNVDGNTAFSCARKQDPSAIHVINNYVKYLSEGILNICNAFRPEAIVLGGGISEQGDFLLDKIREYIKERHYGYKSTPEIKIVKAQLGSSAGIVGAAMMNKMLDN